VDDHNPLAAIVLPPREGFGPARSGALGLLARRHASAPGFRTLVIGGEQDGPPFDDVPFAAIRPAIWWPGNINLRYVAAMLSILRRARPALIEVHNRPEIALALARLFPRLPVGLLLNNDPTDMRAAKSPAARARLLRRLRLVMTSSDFLRRRFMTGIDAEANVEVLHNCIDISAIPPPRPRDNVILFAGRVVRDKAPDSFIRACAQALPTLPGWRAEMIGADGMSATSRVTDYVREIYALAERSGVNMLGYRDHPMVLEAMRSAAIVVVPSRWEEPFGLAALEALACGAPLVVAPRGGLPEVAGDAAVYADPDDPAAIAAAIVALAVDPARRMALSAAGEQRARLFDTKIAAARLAELRWRALRAA
jgi:UDP-glucose:(glucosyl)LPS alpha-1,2-glucosyltransferase